MGRRPLGIAFRDRSLITKRATKWEGGGGEWQLKFYPNKIGGGTSFSHAERGTQKDLRWFKHWTLEVVSMIRGSQIVSTR